MVLSDVTRAVCHVERNLRCLQEMPRVGLTNIKDFRGAQKKGKLESLFSDLPRYIERLLQPMYGIKAT